MSQQDEFKLTTKHVVIAIYVVGIVIATFYNLHHGLNQYRGFFYNFGSALMWPVSVIYYFFPAVREIVQGIFVLAIVLFFVVQGSNSRSD